MTRATETHRRWVLVGMLLILTAGLGLRVAGLSAQSIWRDEADSLLFSASPHQLREMFVQPGHNAPLYYLLLRGWSGLAGRGLFSARLFSALWGTLGIAALFSAGQRLFGRRVALVGAALAAGSPYLIWYAQEARTYAILFALSALSWAIFLHARRSGQPLHWALYLLCTAACLYLHITAILLAPAQILAGLLLGRGSLRRVARSALWLALLALPALPLVWWELRALGWEAPAGLAATPPAQMAGGLLLAFASGPSGLLGLWSALPGLFLALVGAASPWLLNEKALRRPLAALLAWLCLPAGGLALISAVRPIFSERYLIYLAPAFILLLALGLRALWRLSRPLAFLALAALLAVQAGNLYVQHTQPIKPDFRAAAAYFATQGSAESLLLCSIPQAEGAFRLALPAGVPLQAAGAPFPGAASHTQEIDAALRATLAGHTDIWMLQSEPTLWDPAGLIPAWLAEHGRLLDDRPFHLLRLTHYALDIP